MSFSCFDVSSKPVYENRRYRRSHTARCNERKRLVVAGGAGLPQDIPEWEEVAESVLPARRANTEEAGLVRCLHLSSTFIGSCHWAMTRIEFHQMKFHSAIQKTNS